MLGESLSQFSVYYSDPCCYNCWTQKYPSCFKIFPLFIGESLSQFSVYYSDPCCYNCWTQKYPSCFKKISLCLGGSLLKNSGFLQWPFLPPYFKYKCGHPVSIRWIYNKGGSYAIFFSCFVAPPFLPILIERERATSAALLALLALLAFNVQSINRCVRTRTRAIAKPPQRQVFDFADRLADWLAGRLTFAHDACTGVRRDPGLHGPGDRAPGHAPPRRGCGGSCCCGCWQSVVGGVGRRVGRSVGRSGGKIQRQACAVAFREARRLIDRSSEVLIKNTYLYIDLILRPISYRNFHFIK